MNIQIAVNKYQQGKIYEMTNHINGTKYYGSTCITLNRRKIMHDSLSKVQTSPLYEAMKHFGCTNFQISLIKNFPCNFKIELEAEEAKVIADARTAGELLYNVNRPAVVQTAATIIRRAQTAAWRIANADKYQCACCQFATSKKTSLESHLKSAGCRNKMPAYLLEQEIKRLNEIDY